VDVRIPDSASGARSVPAGSDVAKARELLERAEHGCLIASSLRGTRILEARVIPADAAVVAESSDLA